MSIIRAFLYTVLIYILWYIIGLVILLPIKYIVGIPDDYTHIFGITKIISTIGGFFIMYYFFWRPNFDLRKSIQFKDYKPKIYLYLPLVAIGILLVNKPFFDFSKILEYYPESPIIYKSSVSNNSIAFIYNLISAIIIAPIVEELFFRKFLLQQLTTNYSVTISLILSALCFSLIHIETPSNLIPTFISGILLGLIYLKTEKIGYSIALHLIVNSIILTTNRFGTPYSDLLIDYRFKTYYWILFFIGIAITYFGMKKITTANTI